MNYRVSVIIPTYGRASLIGRAIESVLSQEYENIEIIIIDDNSDEKKSLETRKIIECYLPNPAVKYFKNESNIGGALSRNAGILKSTGDFIAFLDDDDYFLKEKINRQLEFMINGGYDVTLSDMIIEDENGKRLNKIHSAQCSGVGDFIIRGVALTPMILARKTCVLDVGMFDDTPRFQDHIFMLKLLGNKAKVGVMNEPLAVHFEHTGARITNSDKTFNGYVLRMKMEMALFHLLSEKELASAKLKHATLNSKILTDRENSFVGVLYLLRNIHLIRTFHDLNIFFRNVVRNLFFRNHRF
ncbi:glycosyltransferase family 2 protein [Klebsiella oxytoca]|uniref:glycosyltransferase family 2 protein n=2 Tax=Klebsiella oxytoca TaxID=571 RepID=UPI000451E16E|nr:glycosyltransferase family 2 protein [Klebsiella oxytoca]ELQ9022323.1 glycosyltransferase family 2 protein [Klebsiella oxytoca]EUC92509.1 glycosyltransferase-like protein, family 2 [Klebsiella oxytoca OK-1]MBK0675265.1 glycosyltransferase family 2 protein [Klebsiella oxytoca]MBK0691033.1 glycosyltransferase family 2 protein [Klebsiella oxytoca]MBX4771845.1 glycosyltransferase family 2 protein [Klebsiella oxytoca]